MSREEKAVERFLQSVEECRDVQPAPALRPDQEVACCGYIINFCNGRGSSRYLKAALLRALDREREMIRLRVGMGMMQEARRNDAREYAEMAEHVRAVNERIQQLERAHYEAVCAGALPGNVEKRDTSRPHIRQPEPSHVELANARQALREQAEEIIKLRVERGGLALKLAGAECFIEEQRKKGNIK